MKNNLNWDLGFADRVRTLIKAESSRAALARKIGIKEQSLAQYLKGSVPGADVILLMAEKCDLSLSWLLTGKDFTEPEPDDKTRQAIANVKEIMASGDETIVLALEVNLAAFKFACFTKKENNELKEDVAQLKKEMRYMKALDNPKRKPISGEVNGTGT